MAGKPMHMTFRPEAGVGFLGMLALLLAAPASAQELTISIWGGSYAEEFRRHVVEPFEEAYGVEVQLDGGLASERLSKLMVTRGRGVDLVYLTDHQMAEASQRGLLQPIDPGNFENLDALYDFARDPLGGGLCPAFTVAGVGLAYNKDHFETPPSSWADLWSDDLEARAGYTDMTVSYGPLLLVMVAELNGGGIDNVDPAFEKLAEIKGDLQIFTRREILDSINQGDASLAPHLNIFVTRDESVPLRFAWPEEGGLGVLNLACVTSSSENPELAQKFIDFHLSQEIQAAMLEAQGETPVRPDVEIPDDLDFNVIAPEEVEKLRFYDTRTIVENRAEWLERWQEEILAR
jgi:putative spermidine/putrescine transport system substrate-binding protein